MNKSMLTLAGLSASILALSACSSSPTDLPPGEYHNSTKSTSADGTNYSSKTTTDVSQDRYGNKKATVTTKSTKDPDGLFNKSTTKTTKTVHD